MGLPGGLLKAQVIQHDPEKGGVYVMLSSAQIPVLARPMYPQADGIRIKKPPLPVRGSWVLVSFVNGDVRNPVIHGAYHPNLVDSLPDDSTDPFSDYESNFNGSWSYTHGLSGYSAQQFADNSSFVMGSGSLNLPTIHRHIVSSGQAQQRVEFKQSDRNPNPQPPFGIKYTQATSGQVGGLSISVDTSGNFMVSGGTQNRSGTITFNGMTFSISPSGINVSAGANPVTVTGNTVTVSGSNQVNVNGASKVILKAPDVEASNGGTVQAVKLADGSNSTVLKAQ